MSRRAAAVAAMAAELVAGDEHDAEATQAPDRAQEPQRTPRLCRRRGGLSLASIEAHVSSPVSQARRASKLPKSIPNRRLSHETSVSAR